MNSIPDLLGAGTTLAVFGLIAAVVMKLFQIASDVRDMKGVLQDIRRNTQDSVRPFAAAGAVLPGSTPGVPTPEELVRAVHAQSFGDDFPL
jgi:hypothetical protein